MDPGQIRRQMLVHSEHPFWGTQLWAIPIPNITSKVCPLPVLFPAILDKYSSYSHPSQAMTCCNCCIPSVVCIIYIYLYIYIYVLYYIYYILYIYIAILDSYVSEYARPMASRSLHHPWDVDSSTIKACCSARWHGGCLESQKKMTNHWIMFIIIYNVNISIYIYISVNIYICILYVYVYNCIYIYE